MYDTQDELLRGILAGEDSFIEFNKRKGNTRGMGVWH
jgi:hypothetical protein